MRRISAAILFAGLSLGLAETAAAADLPVKAAAIAPVPIVYNWTGFYLGINGGGGWSRESWVDNSLSGLPSTDFRPAGGVFGGQLGYRWQWNQLVFGVEGSWDWAGLSDSFTGVSQGFGFTEGLKIKSLYTVTGQVGWALDRTLIYVKGGWAGATTHATVVNDNAQGGVFSTGDTPQTVHGWTVGGGIDYAIWQNLIVGIEYDHFDFNYDPFLITLSDPFNIPAGTPLVVSSTSRLTVDQVVARVSYKF